MEKAVGAAIALPLLLVASQAPSMASSSAAISQTGTPAADVARALTFRQMFGLDADLGLIQRAAISSDYSAVNYGVPLTSAEEAELGRRVQVEQDSHGAAAFGRQQATWGGYYFDQLARGAPVFLFTAGVESMRSQLEKLLPPGTDFRVEHVTRPLSMLQETQEAIVSAYGELRASGIPITSTGLDIIGNRVVVGIDGITDEAQKRITREFGSYIQFKDSPPAQSDACPVSVCRPMKGGIKITGADGFSCTSGFVVRRALDNSYAILTAGHCLWVQNPASPFKLTWYHNTSNGTHDVFGNSRYHTFTNLSDGDVGLIELQPSENPTSANRF
ncbi:MAG: hypothetical protein AB1736_04825 [Chloroflexota bacterium]